MSTSRCDFMDYIDEELAAILGEDFPGYESPGGSDSSSSSNLISIPKSCCAAATTTTTTTLSPEPPQLSLQPPAERQKPYNFSNFSGGVGDRDRASSNPVILSFGNANSLESCGQLWPVNPDEEAVVSEVIIGNDQGSKASKRRRIRPPSQTYDHIMAERKRREQLSQLFIALSSLIPGLKKTDKSSVLGDTITYLKHLQERVKTLEEEAAKQTMESVVLVKKSQILDDDDDDDDEGSSDEKSWSSESHSLPEIKSQVCSRSVLLKILCEKRKGILVKILSEVEKLNLAVVSTSATPFGSLTIDITVVAEMDGEINLTAIDIVKALRSALQAADD